MLCRFLFIFFIHIPVALTASSIEILFSGNSDKEISFKVYSYINNVEKRMLKEYLIHSPAILNFNLEIEDKQYLYFTTTYSSQEVLIEPKGQYQFEYDLNSKRWISFGDMNSYNQLLWLASQEFMNTTKYLSDSTSYVSNFLKIFESDNVKKLQTRDEDSNFNRAAFNLFKNHISSRKLFNLNLGDSSFLSNEMLKWLDIDNLDLRINSKAGFMSLRTYYLANSQQIFDEQVTDSVSYYYLFKKAADWINKQNLKDSIKTFLLGDFIQLYLNLPLDYDVDTQKFLKDFLLENSDSRHFNFIQRELNKRETAAEEKAFNPIMIDLLDQQFSLSKIKERIIYVDFWATWCGPCIEENKFIQKLEDQFSGQVCFLRVSIDEDEEKWKSSQRKLSLDSSKSFIIKSEDRSRVISLYNLEIIPKFLILDNKGTIINSTPRRPSDPGLVEQLYSIYRNINN